MAMGGNGVQLWPGCLRNVQEFIYDILMAIMSGIAAIAILTSHRSTTNIDWLTVTIVSDVSEILLSFSFRNFTPMHRARFD